MIKQLPTLLAGFALALSVTAAQADDKPRTPQQNRMAQCNKEAAGKTGDERKQLMKTCLSVRKDTAQPAKS